MSGQTHFSVGLTRGQPSVTIYRRTNNCLNQSAI